ncbi:polysaccharide deacetylase [Salsuginibacillus halophilus]|uniref:Polysaccharide deacetylase n=1 Tax=Salsuginibacillus halophilus TaxID=517424 RepID=A0A2P8HQK5_9BACI|nr:polysaccharide deacetylase family protein [Salsuginibacillus halophilus]PSL48501.1 polysaccharide deacetylase [Salsuginibacillus halophilus]
MRGYQTLLGFSLCSILLTGCMNDAPAANSLESFQPLETPVYGYTEEEETLVAVTDIEEMFQSSELTVEDEIITFTWEEFSFTFETGETDAQINGETTTINAPARPIQSEAYIPIEPVLENFNVDYETDGQMLQFPSKTSEEMFNIHRKPITSAYKYEPEALYGLMYHDFSPEEDIQRENAQVSPGNFQKQMEALIEGGYETVTDEDIVRFREEDDFLLPEKPVLIAMDDGYQSNYEYAFPILEELGLRASVYPNVERNDTAQERFLSWDEMKEMQESGVMNIQAHSYDHHDTVDGYNIDGEKRSNRSLFVMLEEDESEAAYEARIREDLGLAKERLEDELGHDVHSFTFPFGQFNDVLMDVAEDLGYDLMITIYPNKNTPDDLDDKLFHRMNVPNGYDGEKLLERLNELEPWEDESA